MKEYSEKYHGLPSVGVAGINGSVGKAGNGIYFGFINDFFDSNYIPIDTFMHDAANIMTLNKKTLSEKKYYTGVVQYVDKYGMTVNSSANIDKESTDFADLNANYSSLENVSIGFKNETKNSSYSYGYEQLYLTKYDASSLKYVPKTNILVDMSAIPYEYSAEHNPDIEGFSSEPSAYGVDIVMWNGSVQMYHDHEDYVEPNTSPLDYVRSAINYINNGEDILVDSNGISYKDDQTDVTYLSDLDKAIEKTKASTYYTNDDDYSKLSLKNIDNEIDTKHFNFVKWTSYDYEQMRVPTNLSSKYVEGDVIYVYLDEDAFNTTGMKYTYMIVVTAEMVGKSFSYVLDHLTVADPLQMSNFSETIDSSYLRCNLEKKLTLGKYEGVDGDLKDVFYQNFNEILPNSDYALEISEFNQNEATSFMLLASLDSSLSFQSYINKEDDCSIVVGEHFKIKASNDVDQTNGLKLTSALFRKDAITNFELSDTIVSESARLYGNYAYTFSDDDFSGDYITAKYGFTIDRSKFLTSPQDDAQSVVGAYIVSLNDQQNKNLTVEYLNPADNFIPIDVSFDNTGRLWNKDGYKYEVVPYVSVPSSAKYFGMPTVVTLTNNAENEDDLTVYVSIEEPDSVVHTSDITTIDTTSPIKFTMNGELSAEKNSSIFLNIASDDASILGIYINGVDLSDSDEDRIDFASWISGTLIDSENISFSVDDNLPNINGIDYSTFDEYMKSCSSSSDGEPAQFFILKQNNSLYSTASRNIVVTVVYTQDNELTTKKATYEIVQPGFKDPRVIPDVSLISRISQVDLEKSNSIENGILANQFQWFIDVSVDGFNNQSWAKYTDDVSVDLTIETDWTNYTMLTDYNYPTLQVYNIPTLKIVPDDISVYKSSDIDTSAWEDNYISLDIKVVDGSINLSSTALEIETNANAMISSSSTWYEIDSSYMHADEYNVIADSSLSYEAMSGKEVVMLDSSLLANVFKNPGMNWSGLYKGFKINICGLTPDMLNNSSKVKLRILFEEGNPIPSMLAMNFKVTDIKVHYDGVLFECVDDLKNGVELLSSVKNKNEITEYNLPSMMTGIQTFFINPLSFVASPKDLEVGTTFSGTGVKLYGSSDEIKVGAKLYGERSTYKLYSDVKCSNIGSRAVYQYVNWHAWKLKCGFLQDDIKNITISPEDPFEVLSLLPDTDPFKHAVRLYNEPMQYNVINWNNQSELIWRPFESDESFNHFDECPYLSVVYNSTLMKSKKRDDISTFYYNNELYEADRYSQFNYNAPLMLSTELKIEERDTSLLNSIEVWNYEFEVNPNTSKSDAEQGAISTYGNGYIYLDNNIDTSQYEEDEALSLSETKERNDKYILVDWSSMTVKLPDMKKDNIPEEGKCFRTLVYDLAWQYPTFDNDETFYAFDIVPSFYSLLDTEFVGDAYKYAQDNGYTAYDEAKPYTKWVNDAGEMLLDSLSQYSETYAEQMTEKYGAKKWTDDEVTHNMVPYTLTYNVYPRILHNSDYNTTNVLMLRAPSIRDSISQTLDTLYFNLEDSASRERCKQPYNMF